MSLVDSRKLAYPIAGRAERIRDGVSTSVQIIKLSISSARVASGLDLDVAGAEWELRRFADEHDHEYRQRVIAHLEGRIAT